MQDKDEVRGIAEALRGMVVFNDNPGLPERMAEAAIKALDEYRKADTDSPEWLADPANRAEIVG